MTIINPAPVLQQIAEAEGAISAAKAAITGPGAPAGSAGQAEGHLINALSPLHQAMRLLREGKDAVDAD